MRVRHGVIETFTSKNNTQLSTKQIEEIESKIIGRKLQDIHDWHETLGTHDGLGNEEFGLVASFLEKLLPVPKLPRA